MHMGVRERKRVIITNVRHTNFSYTNETAKNICRFKRNTLDKVNCYNLPDKHKRCQYIQTNSPTNRRHCESHRHLPDLNDAVNFLKAKDDKIRVTLYLKSARNTA